MRYQQKSFSVPASGGTKAVCEQVGHMDTDRWGKCMRCGEKLRARADRGVDDSPAFSENAGGDRPRSNRIVGA